MNKQVINLTRLNIFMCYAFLEGVNLCLILVMDLIEFEHLSKEAK